MKAIISLEQVALAIIKRQSKYHWWNRPHLTITESKILHQYFKEHIFKETL